MFVEQVQVNVRVPADWKPVIEDTARNKGVSLNEFLQGVIRRSLPDRGKGLSEPRRKGRPTGEAASDE